MPNPFTERSRITNPERFVGRWREISLIFDRIEARRPVLITGIAGIGKSSLLTHIVQSAAVNLEQPDLRAYYLDLTHAESASHVYATLIRGLREQGDTLTSLELAIALLGVPIVFCLDNAQNCLERGWGDKMLEGLARVARSGGMMLIVALTGRAPLLSERFAIIQLGAFANTEVRLLSEAYLGEQDISFSPRELNQLTALSTGHPAYLQRAAYYLYQHKQDPSFDWRSAYLAEARNHPIPGAPLPPAVFEGEHDATQDASQYGGQDNEQIATHPQLKVLPETPAVLLYLIPSMLGLLIILVGYLALGLLVGGIGILALWLFRRRTP